MKHPGLQSPPCSAGSAAKLQPQGHTYAGKVQKRGTMGFSSLLWGNSLKAKRIFLQRVALKPQMFPWHQKIFQVALSAAPKCHLRPVWVRRREILLEEQASPMGAAPWICRDKLVPATSSKTNWGTSSGYLLPVSWRRRGGLHPYSIHTPQTLK